MLKPVSSQISFPQMEEEILSYWKENNIFEKSISSRPEDKKWTFLDGPPFVTGMPHYGSLLSSLPKDLFGRYYTMKGYRVRRVWGWDGHGLPIENKVENKLHIKRKKDIEDVVGVEKFIDECRKYVEEVSGEWEWYVDRIGRWVDFKNAYRTWDINYMESVMWVFKQMYDKGHIYKGLRVSLFCPHCATPISNFEVAMDADNYKNVTEPANTYKYKLKGEDNTYLLAWSTTPWTKIGTSALAINPELTYVKVKQGEEFYILAESTIKTLKEDVSWEKIEEFKGVELINKEFEPHYDFYKIDEGKKAFIVIGGDFVTADEGTGIVTLAAYGAEDMEVMSKEGIQIVTYIDEEGVINKNVPKFGGMYYLDSNELVNKDLASRGLMYDEKEITHSVAHCWRCATRLFFNPQNAWYVNVADIKNKLKETNEKVNWFPMHFKNGRFRKSLESAPDWNISRSRYWGSPIPVWECEEGHRVVPGSIKELEELSGRKVNDLHKPEIDQIIIKCTNCTRDMKRTPEVLDSWIEAGSASFAERHYPFDGSRLEDFFPPDFIAEYTGQIRAWFYVLHVIGTTIFDSPAFKNVLVEGVIQGTDGRKMSKNFGNYPDPKKLIETYGGDALRMYLLGSPVMNGEDIRISEIDYRDQVRGTLLILWNTYNFFVTYANADGVKPQEDTNSENVLDQWILSKLQKLNLEMTKSLDNYNTIVAISAYKNFVNEFSTWYIRRSRDRVGPSSEDTVDRQSFYNTTYVALITLAKLIAPVTPFISENIFRNLTDKESVHLETWPVIREELMNDKLEKEMDNAISLSSVLNAFRKQAGIKVKIPFRKLSYSGEELSEKVEKIVKEEGNVYELKFNKTQAEYVVEGNTNEENLDTVSGEVRDLIRQIQGERKKMGTKIDQRINVYLNSWPLEFEEVIKKKALVNNLIKSDAFKVEVL